MSENNGDYLLVPIATKCLGSETCVDDDGDDDDDGGNDDDDNKCMYFVPGLSWSG